MSKVLQFFGQHQARELNLYYDRAGNNYQKQGQDQATQIKYALEHDAAGNRTGWTVNLMSRKQATIKQNAEYNFMQEFMTGNVPGLPELAIDGEMQVNFALNDELRDDKYPFTKLKGKKVNTLIFPNLTSANASYKLLQALNPDAEIIGPIQMGLNKPIHFTDFECSVRDVVNITAVAVIDAYVEKIKNNNSCLLLQR